MLIWIDSSGWRKLCSNKDYVAYQILSMTLVLSCLAHRSREDIVWELCYNEPYKNDVDGLTMTGSPCSILSTLPSMHMIMGLGFEYVTCFKINIYKVQNFGDKQSHTLWCQLEDMFQLIVTPQGIEKVMIQLKDIPISVQEARDSFAYPYGVKL